MNLSITSTRELDTTEDVKPKPLTFWKMALAVFTGNMLAGLAGGILYFLAIH